MSLRVLQRRALRPYLSARYQQLLRRQNSTSPPITEASVPPPPSETPTPSPSFFSRYRSAIIASTLALTFGLAVGTYATHVIAPPLLPEAGTHEDTILLADLNKRIDEEFKVKVLRGKCLGVVKQLKGKEGGWVEIVSPDAHEPPGNGGTMMHSLRAAKNLGVERVFWDRGERKLVAIVHFGPDLVGWPGVTHGGLLATALTEKIALANALTSSQNYTAAAVPQRLPGTGDHAKMPLPSVPPHEPAQISIDYVKPTFANNFHVIRVSPAFGTEEAEVRIPIKGHEWEASLETMDARTCVKAHAKFAPRGQFEWLEERLEEVGSKWSYGEFKEWLWPSRQRQSQIG